MRRRKITQIRSSKSLRQQIESEGERGESKVQISKIILHILRTRTVTQNAWDAISVRGTHTNGGWNTREEGGWKQVLDALGVPRGGASRRNLLERNRRSLKIAQVFLSAMDFPSVSLRRLYKGGCTPASGGGEGGGTRGTFVPERGGTCPTRVIPGIRGEERGEGL